MLEVIIFYFLMGNIISEKTRLDRMCDRIRNVENRLEILTAKLEKEISNLHERVNFIEDFDSSSDSNTPFYHSRIPIPSPNL